MKAPSLPLLLTLALSVGCATAPTASPGARFAPRNPVAAHGQLSVRDRTLVDEHGQPVQLRGFSSQTLSGSDIFLNPSALVELRDEWKADVVRAAMYVDDPYAQGYFMNRKLKATMKTVVDDATEAGLYAIIDWHILIKDHDPLSTLDEAKAFFSEMAQTYAGHRNVFYEICNEPNGDVTWKGNIRPYAEQVIAAIRQYDKHNLIIVGTPTWSQDVDAAAEAPLEDPLVLYTMHFYPGTHGQSLRDKVTRALKTIPIFCTEFGTTDATGGGRVFPDELRTWMEFLDENNLSWCNWNLSTYGEASAALQMTYEPLGDERMSERLTDSGQLIYHWMRQGRE